MANFWYTNAKRAFAAGEISPTTDTFKAMLVVPATSTADTEKAVTTLSGFTTLGEYTGAHYARKTLTSITVTQDDVNLTGKIDAADITWTALGADANAAILVYKHVTNDTDSIPLFYIDTGTNLPFNGNGGDVTVAWNANGIATIGD